MFLFSIFYTIIYYGISFIILAMLIRVIASWFRMDERYAFVRFLAYITDPFINPVRRFIGPVGIFDMSYFIAWFALSTLRILLLQALLH